MVDRILGLIREKLMTPSQFADEIGVQRSSVSHIISGRNNPSLEFVMKILKRFPDVDPNWLLFGTTLQKVVPEREPALPVKAEPDVTQVVQPVLKDEDIPQYEKGTTSKKIKPAKQTNDDKTTDRLIIIYKDNTFRELTPE